MKTTKARKRKPAAAVGSTRLVRRKAFICKACGGVYADEPVTQCDCMPEKNEFYAGELSYLEKTPDRP